MGKNKEINERITDDERYLAACQDAAALLVSLQNIMPVLKKSLRKMYPTNEASKDLCVSARVIADDLSSMRLEVEVTASEIADEIHKLKEKRDAERPECNEEV